jgi:hypothetical protein
MCAGAGAAGGFVNRAGVGNALGDHAEFGDRFIERSSLTEDEADPFGFGSGPKSRSGLGFATLD